MDWPSTQTPTGWAPTASRGTQPCSTCGKRQGFCTSRPSLQLSHRCPAANANRLNPQELALPLKKCTPAMRR
eukprot:5366817-Amphidinium_carterae.1